MKRILILLSIYHFASFISISAQDIRFTSNDLVVDSVRFKIETVQDGLYDIYALNQQHQMFFPVYFPSGEGTLELRVNNGCPVVENDNNNKALSAFNQQVYTNSRSYWMDGVNWSAEKIKDYLMSYTAASDSIIALYNPAEPVKKYLRLWAYLHTFNEFHSMPNAVKHKPADYGIALTDILPTPDKVLNEPMAAYFSLAPHAVLYSLPEGTYEERMAYIEANYTNEKLRTQVASMIEKKKTAPKGMPFPENVKLVDRDGNTVDFAQFRGKYVYIDIWASWCGPCIKEVPHLQELEKTLDNPDVVFVSVSIDTTDKPWKAKMEQLNMHGNQFLNADGSIGNAHFVTGIPHFLIYDKEGKLYMTGAPRPSHPSTALMLKDLH